VEQPAARRRVGNRGDAAGRGHQLFRAQDAYQWPEDLDFLGFAPIALPSVVLGSAFM
jgi:hypothetical protein